jgi:rRNA maturation endonuclease Nob1
MKKTREELNEIQEAAVLRRRLLESGRIRLTRPDPKSRPERREKVEETKKADVK